MYAKGFGSTSTQLLTLILMPEYKLYSYWRSSASYRVRIALAIKGVEYTYVAVNLVKKEQLSDAYKQVNPSGLVPALIVQLDDGRSLTLTQSLAIIEYLDEVLPSETVPLLPKDSILKAKAREIALAIACDVHPRQNLKVLMDLPEEQRAVQARKIIADGLQVVECLLFDDAINYCVGDHVSIADLVLVPQVYNAIRWEVDMTAYPKINRIVKHLESLDAFKRAHPDAQPDRP